jgi:integrase
MASVYQRGSKWYLRYKDARGAWCSIRSTAQTKTEARRLAGDLERRAERQRLGLEDLPLEDGGGTLAQLLKWWLTTYVRPTSSYRRTESVVARNLLSSELSDLRLVEVTAAKIEVYLQRRARELSPESLNHLRSYIATAFNRAARAGRWSGRNPALEVARRKVPKRLPDFLRADEVPRVLAVLSPRHRPVFATAIYTGMRKGELAGLRKADVDLKARLIQICRSYDRSTTKGGRAAAIPIARELGSYLEQAMRASTSELVFPTVDGRMMTTHSPLEDVLRRALARAGIVTGYTHVCRKKGCGHAEEASDAEQRWCPQHRHRLWPKAKVRQIRFHDLRHTTASLLLMAGANPAATQRILRHSDPRITTEVYGHLLPGYLRDEIDRLSFPDLSKPLQAETAAVPPFATMLLQSPESERCGGDPILPKALEHPELAKARSAGLEPATRGLEGRRSIQLSYERERG